MYSNAQFGTRKILGKENVKEKWKERKKIWRKIKNRFNFNKLIIFVYSYLFLFMT